MSETFVESNEHGDREVRIVLPRSFWCRLLRRPARVAIFVQPQPGSTVWWFKGSGKAAGTHWDFRCLEVVERARQQAARHSFGWR